MTDSALAPERSSLYGRRKGKKLRPSQAALFETLLPRLALDGAPIADAQTLFPRQPHALWLEIGFGGGEHLVAEAQRDQECGFIGCEPFVNGVAKTLAAIDAARLENIRLYVGDAATIVDALPAECLDGVYLLFPDPWPKRRQRKRRFLSVAMQARLARVMRKGAELRFATDIDDNAGWTLAQVLRAGAFTWPAKQAADWQKAWEGWSPTRYEAKARAAGRRPVYLTFVRK